MVWLSRMGHEGQISLFTFGIKIDIIFKKISVNVFTCQLGSVLRFRWLDQGKLVILLLMAVEFALSKCHIFLSNGGGGGILKFTLQWIIWWWQYESKEARVPLSRIRLGWSVMTWSIHEDFLLGSKFVGLQMIWDRLSEVRRSSIWVPSGVVLPSGHQNWECPLKSPVKNTAKGFSAWIFEYKFLKLTKKDWNSGEVWLKEGLRYKVVWNIFFRPKFHYYRFVKRQIFSNCNRERIL